MSTPDIWGISFINSKFRFITKDTSGYYRYSESADLKTYSNQRSAGQSGFGAYAGKPITDGSNWYYGGNGPLMQAPGNSAGPTGNFAPLSWPSGMADYCWSAE